MGFYDEARFAEHHAAISAAVVAFNADKAGAVGATAAQAAGIPDLTAALVEAWLVQEGGETLVPASGAAALANIRAALVVLARKGFGELGQPPSQRPAAVFEGWGVALERYNGRGELTANGRLYRQNYATRILARSRAIAGGFGELPGRELPAPVETLVGRPAR
jgi:hypothetical protein